MGFIEKILNFKVENGRTAILLRLKGTNLYECKRKSLLRKKWISKNQHKLSFFDQIESALLSFHSFRAFSAWG